MISREIAVKLLDEHIRNPNETKHGFINVSMVKLPVYKAL